MDKWYESTFPYWEPQRSFIDESYRTIPFPFKPLKGLHLMCVFPFLELQLCPLPASRGKPVRMHSQRSFF